jgi:hypothetical protein
MEIPSRLISSRYENEFREPNEISRPSCGGVGVGHSRRSGTIGETFETGQTLLFEPTAQLFTSGQSLVCLIIVTTQVIGELRDVVAERDPSTVPDKTSAYSYPVSPKFLRILQGASDANQRQRLQQSLEQRGLKFEAGMTATFRPTDCTVLVHQNREGHFAFMKHMKDLDLMPQPPLTFSRSGTPERPAPDAAFPASSAWR